MNTEPTCKNCNNTGVLMMMMMTIIHCPTMCVTHCLHSNALGVGVSLHLWSNACLW